MKHTIKTIVLTAFVAVALISCKEEKETANDKADAMIENADNVKVKEDKVKIESPDGSETKIKYDDNGNVEKIKTDDNS